MADNVPNLLENINLHIQEDQQAPNRINHSKNAKNQR